MTLLLGVSYHITLFITNTELKPSKQPDILFGIHLVINAY